MLQSTEEKEIVLRLHPDEEFLQELEKICNDTDKTNRVLEEILENVKTVSSSEILQSELEALE